MWRDQDKDKVWMHYLNDIIAADLYSAVFLSSFLRHAFLSGDYSKSLEVMDLQKYKVVRKGPKVRFAIASSRDVPFVFVVGKN